MLKFYKVFTMLSKNFIISTNGLCFVLGRSMHYLHYIITGSIG